ncbi:efflux RND transporter periplasmic adaptor subunit (plasmid) [Rhizobium sp. CB3171]|uniref:efflux RND transporter periplasmic adaptor subunit n=1 Tax=unclassified Rhizobium TaxID=2613769 RepID=UPI000CDF3E41|nr:MULTISPECIES: efflux RND transporter periplasmic adaptor subunit [unclassified Rhizobium]AVA24766.1 RND family efflux transporter protein [Rhizobium sp. NXC24]MDK4740313.1 efflux RND transporter periplasmic adaptor subunit [Rhizobium sp. CNPSo 3464]WFU05645.1 efflux RND transporter periplasmic adaptor subunit [Rhizobium sp. CB3171]
MRNSLIAASLLLATSMLTSCEVKSADTEEKVRPVLSTVIKPEPVVSLHLPGTIEPRIETQLGFRVLGRVVARDVNVGDLVTKGQVVAAIDPLSLELAVRSSRADLSNSQAQLTNASASEERQRALAESRSGSEAALESAEQAQKSAIASVAKAQANLAKAEEQLGYAQLKAEFDGVVTATSAEVGQVVSAGQTVATIARPDVREAVIDIPEASLDGLKPGSPFEIALQLDPTIRVTGIVREIAPEAEATTRTRRTKITLTNPPDAFRLGSIITASAVVDSAPTTSLPSTAILDKDGQPGVWVIDPEKATVFRKPVTLDSAFSDPDRVRIVGGLNIGDRVAIAGVHHLTEGQRVKLTQENQL